MNAKRQNLVKREQCDYLIEVLRKHGAADEIVVEFVKTDKGEFHYLTQKLEDFVYYNEGILGYVYKLTGKTLTEILKGCQ